ncbi:MAG: 2OG-Fe(II) oxygenase [Gammaproteobacteria bacterium]|jgi:PKHD-type hydroxylase
MTTPVRLLPTLTERHPNDTVGLVAFVDGFLSAEECRRIMELSRSYEEQIGRTGDAGKTDSGRDSRVRFVYPDTHNGWVFNRLEEALLRLNENYRFDLHGFFEGYQVASYSSGGHYDWHVDIGTGPFSTRKLSLSVQLSDASEYDGGELEFMSTDELAPRAIGSLVAFPSFLAHRVRPVTRGTRHSLVSWISGPPFR